MLTLIDCLKEELKFYEEYSKLSREHNPDSASTHSILHDQILFLKRMIGRYENNQTYEISVEDDKLKLKSKDNDSVPSLDHLVDNYPDVASAKAAYDEAVKHALTCEKLKKDI